MTGKLHDIEPMPDSRLTEETFCLHTDAEEQYRLLESGNNILGKFVMCTWKYIKCPYCRTEKVLVK